MSLTTVSNTDSIPFKMTQNSVLHGQSSNQTYLLLINTLLMYYIVTNKTRQQSTAPLYNSDEENFYYSSYPTGSGGFRGPTGMIGLRGLKDIKGHEGLGSLEGQKGTNGEKPPSCNNQTRTYVKRTKKSNLFPKKFHPQSCWKNQRNKFPIQQPKPRSYSYQTRQRYVPRVVQK